MVRNFAIRSMLFMTACLVASALVPSPASAGWVPGFTGNTQMTHTSGTTTSGVVDFAVWKNDGSGGDNWTSASQLNVSPTDGFGTGVDTTAQYVYFYEVVNNAGAGGNNFGDLFVNSYPSTAYTSGGYLGGQVFNEASGGAINNSNQYLGTMPSGPDPVTNNPSEHDGALNSSSPFIADANALHPTTLNTLGGVGSGNQADFLFGGSQQLLSGTPTKSYSTVLFLTSNTGPTYSAGSLQGNNVSASGGIPTQAPEPATLAMWGLGALGFGLAARRRKKLAEKTC